MIIIIEEDKKDRKQIIKEIDEALIHREVSDDLAEGQIIFFQPFARVPFLRVDEDAILGTYMKIIRVEEDFIELENLNKNPDQNGKKIKITHKDMTNYSKDWKKTKVKI